MKFEELFFTQENVLSTKHGRRIVFTKGISALLITGIATVTILIITLVFFFLFVPHAKEFLLSSVSAAMATETRGMVTYPFITWVKMSQLTYALCAVGLAIGYALLSSLLTFMLSFFSKNAYINAVVTALLYVVFVAITSLRFTGILQFIQVFTPSFAILQISNWFMEYVLSPTTSYQGYELYVLCVYSLVGLLVMVPIWKRYKTKDVM
mgnify:CR=1 FL=1